MDMEEDKERHDVDHPKTKFPSDSNQNTPYNNTLQAFSSNHARIESLCNKYSKIIEAANKKSNQNIEALEKKCREKIKAVKMDYVARIESEKKMRNEKIEDQRKKLECYEKELQDFKEMCIKFDDRNAFFDAAVYGNVKNLHERISRLKFAETNRIQGLEARIAALLQEDEDNQVVSNKISFLDCLRESNESDDGYWALKSIKMQAINQGKSLSRLVFNLMVLMSEDDQMMAKFQVLRDALKWVSQGENSVVIKRFVDLLHVTDVKLVKKESKKRKAWMMLEEEEEEEEGELKELAEEGELKEVEEEDPEEEEETEEGELKEVVVEEEIEEEEPKEVEIEEEDPEEEEVTEEGELKEVVEEEEIEEGELKEVEEEDPKEEEETEEGELKEVVEEEEIEEGELKEMEEEDPEEEEETEEGELKEVEEEETEEGELKEVEEEETEEGELKEVVEEEEIEEGERKEVEEEDLEEEEETEEGELKEVVEEGELKEVKEEHPEEEEETEEGELKEVEEEKLKEDFTDETFLTLLKEIFRMELFWMHRLFPNSKITLMKNAYPLMVVDVDKCGQALKIVEAKVRELRKVYVLTLRRECRLTMKESHDDGAMDPKINEL